MYGTGSIVAVAIIVPAVAVIVPTVNEYCSRCCCAVVVNDLSVFILSIVLDDGWVKN